MTKKQKKLLIRIIISAILTLIIHFIPIKGIYRFILYLLPYLVAGYNVLIKAIKGISGLRIFDENFLMAVATIGALVLGILKTGDYNEAVMVMLFYQLGEFFQSYAVSKSRKNIANLMDIRPEYANLETDGKTDKVSPELVKPGSVIMVFPGEKIPIDGVIIEGNSVLDTSNLTGESIPESVCEKDEVISGCINISGVLKIKTTKEFKESAVSKILELTENAASKKSHSENFISRFSKYYTPTVCIFALLLAVLPPLTRLYLMEISADFSDWIYRALTFLVISCPCALVISVPLSFFSAIGGASRAGILVKGSVYLEKLAKATVVAFDKTGTLTEASFEVTRVRSITLPPAKLIEYAAHAESISSHPVSRSIINAYNGEPDLKRVTDAREISGKGIIASVDKEQVIIGNEKLLSDFDIECENFSGSGTVVHIAVAGEYAGFIVISDKIKKNAGESIAALKKCGVRKTVMLTGDKRKTAEEIAGSLNIDEFFSELLPEDKVLKLEELIKNKKDKETVVFVGDGINDAPVIMRADIGIAMGGIGSDAAIEAADIVLTDDNPAKIHKAIEISKKCRNIVYENIIFAIGIKFICLILGALGISDMRLAIFSDVGVMVIAVLNAMRALYAGRN